jgi:hypothetical protein
MAPKAAMTGGASFAIMGLEAAWYFILLVTLVSLAYALWRVVPRREL